MPAAFLAKKAAAKDPRQTFSSKELPRDRFEQTICALATPPGEGGIAVVRVSGPDAYAIVEKVFAPLRAGRTVAAARGYTALLGHYTLRGEEMDETMRCSSARHTPTPARM